MRVAAGLLFLAWMASGAGAQTASATRDPRIGYLYPAGASRGTTIQMLAGGQRLRNVTDVFVSGDGVHGTVIHVLPSFRNVSREQIQEARTRLAELRSNPPSPASRPARPTLPPGKEPVKRGVRKSSPPTTSPTTRPTSRTADPSEIDVSALTLRELEYLVATTRSGDKRQPNAQIADVVLLEITIDPNAAQGDRELRLASPAGLTNPLRFQVGHLPEICEQEPMGPKSSAVSALELPVLINGQIMPGDVDRFRFHAQQGQRLVLDVQARQLIPYLADAVPGWFQATLALYDAEGHELAFTDDYRFNPDPVLLYEVPEDGEYQLEIRDAIYRGREDFVYRVSVAESLFVTHTFPLGGRTGTSKMLSVSGWNLPGDRLRVDTTPGPDGIRKTTLRRSDSRSNEVLYAVDALPESLDTEPNDEAGHAQAVNLPRIVNGHIAPPGDADVFAVSGRKGEEVVVEVCARRLNSPLDSQLELLDASGQLLESNDDCEATATGLLTHHADSYLRVTLPETGTYFVRLTDAQQHGGDEYGYRLRISHPQPEVELRVTPSSINIPAGRATPVRVHVLRRDGYGGEIELALKDAPPGFTLAGGRIPPGRDSVRVTIAAPRERPKQPVTLQLEGRARIGDRTVTRRVVPAEDMMQAFIYRHLVPSQELRVAVTGAGRVPEFTLGSAIPVRIPAGGTAEVQLKLPPRAQVRDLKAELNEPPAGITLQTVREVAGGAVLVLRAAAEGIPPEFADNLVVELSAEAVRPQQDGASTKPSQRSSIGFLPAIPIEVVPG